MKDANVADFTKTTNGMIADVETSTCVAYVTHSDDACPIYLHAMPLTVSEAITLLIAIQRPRQRWKRRASLASKRYSSTLIVTAKFSNTYP